MKRLRHDGDPVRGVVRFDPIKAARLSFSLFLGTLGTVFFFDLQGALLSGLFTGATMYVAVVAYHRLIIHRSFACPRWVEYTLVFIANLTGMGGPIGLIANHDLRDWAQRKPTCHPYLANGERFLRDGWQQLFCRLELEQPPVFDIETNGFYNHLERCWLLYQIPLGVLFYLVGGWSLVFGGVFLKLGILPCSHWVMAWFLHHVGQQPAINEEAGVQGFNIPALGLLTFGESYHNNHHRCPDAASNHFRPGELDPAWWLICLLKKLHLASEVRLFEAHSLEP